MYRHPTFCFLFLSNILRILIVNQNFLALDLAKSLFIVSHDRILCSLIFNLIILELFLFILATLFLSILWFLFFFVFTFNVWCFAQFIDDKSVFIFEHVPLAVIRRIDDKCFNYFLLFDVENKHSVVENGLLFLIDKWNEIEHLVSILELAKGKLDFYTFLLYLICKRVIMSISVHLVLKLFEIDFFKLEIFYFQVLVLLLLIMFKFQYLYFIRSFQNRLIIQTFKDLLHVLDALPDPKVRLTVFVLGPENKLRIMMILLILH